MLVLNVSHFGVTRPREKRHKSLLNKYKKKGKKKFLMTTSVKRLKRVILLIHFCHNVNNLKQ